MLDIIDGGVDTISENFALAKFLNLGSHVRTMPGVLALSGHSASTGRVCYNFEPAQSPKKAAKMS